MSRPASILHVLNYYSPHVSGLTEYARLVAESLATTGYEITVLTMRHNADLPPREVLRGVQVVRAEPLIKLHKGILSLDFLRLFRKLVTSADVVHLHLPMLEAGLLARLIPETKPLVITYQCDLAPTRSWSVIDRLAVSAVRASGRASGVRAQRILVSSNDYAAGSPVVGKWCEKWVEAFPPDNAPFDLQPRLDAIDGPKTVGFLGRFVEEKGIDVILEAIPTVIREHSNTRFVLAGDYKNVPGGSEMARLRSKLERLRDYVEVPGKLPADRLFAFYRSLDIFLLPSTNAYEAFGIVQIEAMKAGVPVIATNMRGVRVPVRLTGCGMLVPPGDPQALAAAINQGLRGEWKLTAAEISARAWKVFSNQATVDTIRKVYEEVAPSKSSQ